MNVQLIIILLLAILAVIILVTRLAGGRYGKLYPSKNALESYTSFRVDPEKHYYVSGPDLYPNALLGLNKDWVLKSDLWKKGELDDIGIKELVLNMQYRATEKSLFLDGFDVLDDRGLKIGDWYSITGLHIVIKILEDKKVSITTPPLDIYTVTK